MKRIYSLCLAGCLLVMIFTGACSKKIDDAYLNPNADVKKPIEELLPNIIANMTANFSAAGSGYGTQNDILYIARYVQYWGTNTTNNQYDRMGPQSPFTNVSSVMGAVWAAHYFGQGMNIEKVIEWGTEDKKWDYVGVVYAIRAWSWLTLTNLHGEVILHDAFKDLLTFRYDPQSDVYDRVRAECHLALDYLNRTGDGVSQANLAKGDAYMNNGDVEKWKKFTYAVLARSFNQLTNKSTYSADSVIKYCNLANMTSNNDNTTMRFAQTGVSATFNYFAAFRGNCNTLRQTRFIAELLSGKNPALTNTTTPLVDPRAPYLIRENANGTYLGGRPTKGADGLVAADQPEGFNGQAFATTTAPANDAGSRYVFKNDAKFPIITASEVQFMKAEALYRKGLKGQALAAYTLGVNLSFDLLVADYEGNVPAARRMNPTTRAAYFADPNNIPTNENNLTLSKIMLQKYIALYIHGAIETWVDLRRYHYAVDQEGGFPVYRNFAVPDNPDLWPTNNFLPVQRCLPRGASEAYNLAEFNKIGGNRPDYHTIEQWFSKAE